MPQPHEGESEADYVHRCVPVVMAEGDTQDQALGKCYGMYRSEKSEIVLKKKSAMPAMSAVDASAGGALVPPPGKKKRIALDRNHAAFNIPKLCRKCEKSMLEKSDEHWVTIQGTHVLIGDGGKVVEGPENLKHPQHHAAKKAAEEAEGQVKPKKEKVDRKERNKVENDLVRGKPISPEMLAKYPDIAAKLERAKPLQLKTSAISPQGLVQKVNQEGVVDIAKLHKEHPGNPDAVNKIVEQVLRDNPDIRAIEVSDWRDFSKEEIEKLPKAVGGGRFGYLASKNAPHEHEAFRRSKFDEGGKKSLSLIDDREPCAGYCMKYAEGTYALPGPTQQESLFDEKDFCITFPFAASTDRDREGDFLEVGGISLENHKKNPVAYLDHGKTERSQPIGLCRDHAGNYTVTIDEGRGLAVATVYLYDDPFCHELFRRYQKGLVRGGSIGFRPTNFKRLDCEPGDGFQRKKDGSCGMHIIQCDLNEVTLTSLPVHQDAVQKSLLTPPNRIWNDVALKKRVLQ